MHYLLLASCLLITCEDRAPVPGHNQGAEAVEWLTDLDVARRVAQKHNKPLFVVFRCER